MTGLAAGRNLCSLEYLDKPVLVRTFPCDDRELPRRINNIMLLVSEKRRTHGEAEIEEEADKNNESYTLPW